MFNWLRSLFGNHETVIKFIPTKNEHIDRVWNILVTDGKISGRDIKEICGTADKVKKCIKSFRDDGHNVICKPTPLSKVGGKHQFNGTCVEYVLVVGE